MIPSDPEVTAPRPAAPPDDTGGTVARPVPPDDRTVAREPSPADPDGTVASPAQPPPDTTRPRDTEPVARATPGMPDVPGYAVTHELARGGMGVVYAAHDPAFARPVAVKVMHAGQDAARFVIESQVTAQLPHPGVPPVYALGTLPDGRPFLAMKLIQGRTLGDEIKGAPPSDLPRLIGALESICQTVGFAHARDIIHRDLKPANVMVGAFGEVLVMDWGLARAVPGANGDGPAAPLRAGANSDETRFGEVKGTPAYMAPEQARGEPVDPRADVFALGGILCAILTGKAPFGGANVVATVKQAAAADLSAARERLGACGADRELVAVAVRCLAPRAADRYPDGAAVAAAVAGYRAGVDARLRAAERARAAAEAKAAEEVNTRREAEAKAAEQRKRRKAQLALTGALAVLLAAGGAFAWWRDSTAKEQRLAEERAEVERERIDGARLRAEEKAAAENEFKVRQARQGIGTNLRLASELRGQHKFEAAAGALAQAAALADGAPERGAEIEQARADLALVAKLDDIRFRKWAGASVPNGTVGWNTKVAPPEYRAAFAATDLDLAALAPDDAARRIAARPVWRELVAALDDWAMYEPDEAFRLRLFEVARRADPDAWANRLRDPAARADPAALEAAAAACDTAREHPSTICALAELMWRARLNPAPLLAAARAAHPDQFDLAFVQGLWHEYRRDKRQVGPYEAARALRPTNRPVWNNLGLAYYAQNDLESAIAAYRGLIALDKDFALGHHNLAVALRDRNELADARAHLTRALELAPNFAPSHSSLGAVLYLQGETAAALAAYDRALALDPTDAIAHTNRGAALHERKNDLPGALAAHRRALELAPNFALAHHNLGSTLRSANDLTGAAAAFRRCIELEPGNAEHHNQLGTTLQLAGDGTGAVAAFKRAVELDPKIAVALANLGETLRKQNDRDGALVFLRRAVELDPKSAPAHNHLGILLAERGDRPGAVAAFRRAVALDPKFASPHNGLGTQLAAGGDLDGAITAYRRAVELDPAMGQAYQNLGLALIGKKDSKGAVPVFKRAAELMPKSASAHTDLALAYMMEKQFAECAASARAAVALDPKSANAHAFLGIGLVRSGDPVGARAAMLEAMRLDPNMWTATLSKALPPLPLAPPPRAK